MVDNCVRETFSDYPRKSLVSVFRTDMVYYIYLLLNFTMVFVLKTKIILQCHCRRTDYWAVATLGDYWFISIGIMKRSCVTYNLQVCRQRRIAKFLSFGIFNLRSLGYIVSIKKGRHGRDRIVVRFMTTYVISAYHH